QGPEGGVLVLAEKVADRAFAPALDRLVVVGRLPGRRRRGATLLRTRRGPVGRGEAAAGGQKRRREERGTPSAHRFTSASGALCGLLFPDLDLLDRHVLDRTAGGAGLAAGGGDVADRLHGVQSLDDAAEHGHPAVEV